ncbi:hypothetical protein [Pedosphaera parvula]|uniref:Uncharacterized protein n=1 Tax=Pedosphaera parvula (strain Ellin514) TaxID=320771 RepID=B9XN33_PEDPL|nr:hypothetical protein [Pedosphaera parvula]EEF58695.1 hypothetical protein Cflav_PD1791 [Pedosphaera parvula Ellin514]
MKHDQLEEGRIASHSRPLGTVTREMVLERARQLAVINGRSPHEVIEGDFEQARRELLGEDEASPKESLLESVPESERWDPVPGSTGSKAEQVPAHDEQTDNEKLVQEGVEDAEHDQMLEGAKEGFRRDQA